MDGKPPTVHRVLQELETWLSETLPDPRSSPSPESIRDWQRLLFSAGWATPGWPVEYGGRGLPRALVAAVNQALGRSGAPVPYHVVSVLMIGEVLQALGTEEQRRRFLPAMAGGELTWCQLFSEPGAGSDLSSLATRARRDGGTWSVTGQKVWSSFAHTAGRGLLLARTDPTVPKHHGITAFAVSMDSPGVAVRPLKQITGESTFCEVFLDEVRVPDADRIGSANEGWSVARAVLEAERNLLGGSGTSPLARVGGMPIERLLGQVRVGGSAEIADRLVELWIRDRATGLAVRDFGGDPAMAPVLKVAQSEHNQAVQELAVDLLGVAAVGFDADDPGVEETVYGYLRSKANTIGGGTSEILRTMIGERVLGLAKEPNPFRGLAWQDVPRS
jgi:alkylation response protein AidB-like acyl-CoA dehydrogenase